MRPAAEFSVEVRRDGTTVVVAATGELDVTTQGRLRRALATCGGCETLVLDLRGLSFIDSSGIVVLVDERRRSAGEGYALRVVSGPPPIQRVLEISGVADHLHFVESPTSAAE